MHTPTRAHDAGDPKHPQLVTVAVPGLRYEANAEPVPWAYIDSMRTGRADLPLHPGRCPPWLFERMRKLAGIVSELVIHEYSTDGYLRRLSDPYFFQAFSCLVGFDWHSSGSTTTLCGALKESVNIEKHGIAVLGGKGKTSKKTPEEIERTAHVLSFSTQKTDELIYSSKMSAKVDSALVQDSYQLYHHSFFLSEKGEWAVVQQGLNEANGYARRYHWLSDKIQSFVVEPQTAICCDQNSRDVLNMVAKEGEGSRKASVDITKEDPERLKKYLSYGPQTTLLQFDGAQHAAENFTMAQRHSIDHRDYKKFMDLHEFQPHSYEEIVAFPGIGPKTIRSLALLGELVYGEAPSWRDPVKYSFSHGGKDGFPYPVDKPTYDKTIQLLEDALKNAELGDEEKLKALTRLKRYASS